MSFEISSKDLKDIVLEDSGDEHITAIRLKKVIDAMKHLCKNVNFDPSDKGCRCSEWTVRALL